MDCDRLDARCSTRTVDRFETASLAKETGASPRRLSEAAFETSDASLRMIR